MTTDPKLPRSLHERAAAILGWTPREVTSIGYHTIRELVRHAAPDLAADLSAAIRAGDYTRGPVTPCADMSWLGAPPTTMESDAYELKRAAILAAQK